MDRAPGWRPIEAEGIEQPAAGQPSEAAPDQLRLVLAGIAGLLAVMGVGAVLWLNTPQPQLVLDGLPTEQPGGLAGPVSPSPGGPAEQPATLLVDVQGAVVRPGLHSVPAGSRVGDAISAAGGYGPQLDVRAAAERLNLAEPLADGAKLYVPARGDPTPQPAMAGSGAPAGGSGGQGSGLIDVNTASQAQLETLPGIGPVTAGKIIAAREEAPFGSVDELLARKVVGPATMEKIRPLISVGP